MGVTPPYSHTTAYAIPQAAVRLFKDVPMKGTQKRREHCQSTGSRRFFTLLNYTGKLQAHCLIRNSSEHRHSTANPY